MTDRHSDPDLDYSSPTRDLPTASPQCEDDRRSLLAKIAAGAISAVVGLVPLVSGLIVFFDPLRKKKARADVAVRVAMLESVPPDGIPRRFPVVAARTDAWSRYPPQPIGAVFLRRTESDQPPMAYSAVCTHLGCTVNFKPTLDQYQCPCHNSSWRIDAQRINPETCPAPRSLDELDVEIRNGNEIWVVYKHFRSGISAKIEE